METSHHHERRHPGPLWVIGGGAPWGQQPTGNHYPTGAGVLRTVLTLALCLLLTVAAPVEAGINLPEIGDPASALLSPSQEQQLGRTLLREVRRTLPLSNDPILLGYVEALGQRLVSSAPDAHPNFTFLVVDDPRINAFAMPGGIIGINTGLIDAARNEGELAAVIAHEIAHVTQRHIARAYAGSTRIDLATGLAVLAGIIASAHAPEVGQAAIIGGMAGAAQARINFTRAHEQEADRIGISILAAAHYDPQSMPGFFERMLQLSGGAGESVPEYLRTHPVTSSRITDSRLRADQYSGDFRTDSQAFQMIRARVQALHEPARVIDHHTRSRRDKENGNVAGYYGHAIALIQRGQTRQALELLHKASDATGEDLYLSLAKAEAHMAARPADHPAALAILERLNDLYPGHLPVTQIHVQALIGAGDYGRAIQRVDSWPASTSTAPELLRLKADAAARLGREAVSHETLAEYYFHHGQYRETVRQLDMALVAPDLTWHVEERVRSKRAIALRFVDHR
ncbi:Putative Zn-dependent protease, contains TPR repeats [Ectothiorhodospira magna]|uniref:Putative Zn-dependent protease, contains TPR repeats n=1 Tax=Ectothiorhodospira magna TaxID=867345 RepID=A0A1H9B2W3_9GAMM|nr:M48 family metalloprotease [Ectothiorhodospira magna]SEP83372.1 Putative Zn-dependent protease, contains TPR repeats [Ectothiorhodospira magna]